MRIGIDARAAAEEAGGRSRYVRELLRALARLAPEHEFLLYAREPWSAVELGPRFRWELVRARDPLWHVRVARRASAACDAYLSTNSYLTAWFLRVPTAIVVFDAIAFDRRLRPRLRARLIERATLRPALRRAAAIVAISESTRRDLVARFPAARDKTEAIPLAADSAFGPGGSDGVAASLGVERPYVLVTGTLEPRKNLPRVIEAFARLPATLREGHELVLVGRRGWRAEETLASVEAHSDRVRMLGHVADEQLPALYRSATVVCYASLYEGFGLPVLEAMRSGTPVVTSNLSSMPEVGGDAARYVDPHDVDSIRAGLEELLSDPGERERLAEAGLRRAAAFSWERTAASTLALLETLGA